MIRKANVCLFGVAAIASLMGAAGCSPTEPTQIIAGMATQMRVPDEIRSVGLVLQSDGKQLFCNNYQVDEQTHLVTLPSTFSASSQGDVTKPLTITVLGFPEFDPEFENNCFVERTVASGPLAPRVMRRRRSTFMPNEMLYMPMPLRHSCDGVQCDNDNETCIAGKCQQKVDIDPRALGRYDEELVYGRASSCFDVSKCANPGVTSAKPADFPNVISAIPAILKKRETCEFEVKIPDEMMKALSKDAGLNVSIVHDNFTWEVLDQDDQEGFFFEPDSDGLTTFRLAEGLCEQRFGQGKMVDVMVSVGCPSKPALQPLCENNQKDISGGTLGPVSVANQPPLMANSKLNSVDVALLILIDDSKLRTEMIEWAAKSKEEQKNDNGRVSRFFSMLDNPALSNLHIGIAATSGSGDSVFEAGSLSAAYDQQKQSSSGTIDQMREQVRGWEMVTGSPDSRGWFDGEKVIGMLEDGFVGRNAIVLVTDRRSPDGVVSKGESSGSPEASMTSFNEEAKEQAESELYVLLTSGDTRSSEAFNEGFAGVMAPENAENSGENTLNEQVILNLAKIVTDLAACKYKVPEGLGPNSMISYLNYSDKTRVQIAPCRDDTGNKCNGWKLLKDSEGPYIELQGEACTDFRESLSSVALSASGMGGVIPEAPLFVSSR